LVEVVVAVGIFAIAVASTVGLVAAITRNVSEVQETDDASRLVTTLQSKLQAVSFADIRAYMGDVTAKAANARIYASRDGSKLGLGNTNSVWDSDGNAGLSADEQAQKYFLIEILTNDDLSPDGNDNTAGFLACTVRLIYPAYLGDGNQVIDSSQQNVMVVPVALTR
jgi:type II secretory pathway pseudopilin PulG